MTKYLCLGVVFILLGLTACGGRLPTSPTTQKIIRKHFHKYGKKYEKSPFGDKKVTQIEILEMEELHKHLVSVLAFVTIEGPEVFKIRITIEKGPFGWRTVAWENMGG